MKFNFFCKTSSIKDNCNTLIKKYSKYAISKGLSEKDIDDDIETIVESFEFKKHKFSSNVNNFLKISQVNEGDSEQDSSAKSPANQDQANSDQQSRSDNAQSGGNSFGSLIGNALVWAGYNSALSSYEFNFIYDLFQKYMKGQLNLNNLIISSPIIKRLYETRSIEKVSLLWSYLNNMRQANSKNNFTSQDPEREAKSLEAINYWRREKGLPEFSTLAEAKADQMAEKNRKQNLQKEMIIAIADGDLDYLMELQPTIQEFNELVNRIINGAPKSKDAYNQEHFENLITSYLAERYGISQQRNEAVYNNFIQRIIKNDQWQSGLKERRKQEEQNRRDETHQRYIDKQKRDRERRSLSDGRLSARRR